MWFLTRKGTKKKEKEIKGHREGRHRKKTVTVETLHRHIYSIEETSESSSEDEATSSFELRSINTAVSSDVETGQSVSLDDEEISDNTALDDAPVEQIDLAQIQEDDEDTFNVGYEKALRPSIPSKKKRGAHQEEPGYCGNDSYVIFAAGIASTFWFYGVGAYSSVSYSLIMTTLISAAPIIAIAFLIWCNHNSQRKQSTMPTHKRREISIYDHVVSCCCASPHCCGSLFAKPSANDASTIHGFLKKGGLQKFASALSAKRNRKAAAFTLQEILDPLTVTDEILLSSRVGMNLSDVRRFRTLVRRSAWEIRSEHLRELESDKMQGSECRIYKYFRIIVAVDLILVCGLADVAIFFMLPISVGQLTTCILYAIKSFFLGMGLCFAIQHLDVSSRSSVQSDDNGDVSGQYCKKNSADLTESTVGGKEPDLSSSVYNAGRRFDLRRHIGIYGLYSFSYALSLCAIINTSGIACAVIRKCNKQMDTVDDDNDELGVLPWKSLWWFLIPGSIASVAGTLFLGGPLTSLHYSIGQNERKSNIVIRICAIIDVIVSLLLTLDATMGVGWQDEYKNGNNWLLRLLQLQRADHSYSEKARHYELHLLYSAILISAIIKIV